MQTLQTIAVYTALHALGMLTAVTVWTILLFLAIAAYEAFCDMFY